MTQPEDRCSVKLEDRYIDVRWDGRISREMAAACAQDIAIFANQMKQAGQPVNVRYRSVDPPAMPNTDAFDEVLKLLGSGIGFNRIAIWGPMTPPVKMLLNVLMGSFSKLIAIKYIEDEDAALEWLLAK